MVRRCADLRELPLLIRSMIDGYQSDEVALEAYVAAVLELSQGVNWYSVLLEKKGVHSERSAEYAEEVEQLARYTLACINGGADAPPAPAAAGW
jgi:hypothetical protein